MGCITCSNEFGGNMTTCPHDGTRLTPLSHDDLVGTILDGRYEINELLGGGGMGLVYKAKHRLINRTVAIKVLHKHMVSSGDVLKRFRLEAEAASSLNLPNILAIHDFGISERGQPYMVMDYLAGVSLQDVLEAHERVDVVRALGIFSQVCTALKHAHDKQVIHRDLKPSNIMLIEFEGEPDFVKIVDFGIAKLLGRTEGELAELTRTGEIFGSPLFMSPEQCRGLSLDGRTDIYSLGSVMYLTLCGRPLFESENVLDIFFKQSTAQPARFSEICPELAIPGEVEEIVFKALEKEPSARFQSMAELKIALDKAKEYLSKLGTETGTIPSIETKPQEASPVQEPIANHTIPTTQRFPATGQGKEHHFGKRQVVILFSGAAFLIGLLGLSFQMGKHEGSKQEATTQTQLDKNAPVIIQQSLKPSGTVRTRPAVVDPQDAAKSQNPTLLHQTTAIPSPAPKTESPALDTPKPAPEAPKAAPVINATNQVIDSKPNRSSEPVRKRRWVRQQPPHRRSLLKKAFQILEKAF